MSALEKSICDNDPFTLISYRLTNGAIVVGYLYVEENIVEDQQGNNLFLGLQITWTNHLAAYLRERNGVTNISTPAAI